MAIMDHFGYYTQPLRSHADPLWFQRMDFMPWLEYMKEQKRLHIIKDPSVSGDLNKRLQCMEEKIKAQMKNMKVKIKVWEVLMLVDSEVAAWVSDVAETVDYFG